MDKKEVTKLNLIVNKLSKIEKDFFYFSISSKKISTSQIPDCNDSIKIETFPLFSSAEIILNLINENGVKVADLTFTPS